MMLADIEHVKTGIIEEEYEIELLGSMILYAKLLGWLEKLLPLYISFQKDDLPAGRSFSMKIEIRTLRSVQGFQRYQYFPTLFLHSMPGGRLENIGLQHWHPRHAGDMHLECVDCPCA